MIPAWKCLEIGPIRIPRRDQHPRGDYFIALMTAEAQLIIDRGYSKDEAEAFIRSVSPEWEDSE